MANLSAHGAELARATKETTHPATGTLFWERNERAYMADGWILEKRTVRFRPSASWDPPAGRLHTWGWKLRGKVKDGFTVTAWVDYYRKSGWSVQAHVPLENPAAIATPVALAA
jgi:hypothetical protein